MLQLTGGHLARPVSNLDLARRHQLSCEHPAYTSHLHLHGFTRIDGRQGRQDGRPVGAVVDGHPADTRRNMFQYKPAAGVGLSGATVGIVKERHPTGEVSVLLPTDGAIGPLTVARAHDTLDASPWL